MQERSFFASTIDLIASTTLSILFLLFFLCVFLFGVYICILWKDTYGANMWHTWHVSLKLYCMYIKRIETTFNFDNLLNNYWMGSVLPNVSNTMVTIGTTRPIPPNRRSCLGCIWWKEMSNPKRLRWNIVLTETYESCSAITNQFEHLEQRAIGTTRSIPPKWRSRKV